VRRAPSPTQHPAVRHVHCGMSALLRKRPNRCVTTKRCVYHEPTHALQQIASR
jgi:hypothetical protein